MRNQTPISTRSGRRPSFLRRFIVDARGNYAILFALSVIPILIAVGAAIDISRAYVVKQRMTKALDAAGLAVAGMTGLTNAQIQTTAQNFFNANYPATKIGVPGTLTVSSTSAKVMLSASASMPTAIMGIIGVKTMSIAANSEITKLGKKLEVALVFDNTGSMSQNSKLSSLQTAAKSFLTVLQNSAPNAGDVKVAIVPFTTDVNVGSSNSAATWLKWSWTYPSQTCTTTWRGTTCTSTTSTKTVSKTGWKGCVTDRDQSDDVSVTPPSTSDSTTLYPADNANTFNNNCSLQSLMSLSYDWTALTSKINAMTAGGSTNTTIGLVWGWNMLTQGMPLSTAAAADPKKINKVLIFLTDGDNTYYRQGAVTCDGSNICAGADARTALVCSAIKDAGITVYTIRTLDGNATLLSACSSGAGYYYDVSSASQLNSIFTAIATSISNLRISQ